MDDKKYEQPLAAKEAQFVLKDCALIAIATGKKAMTLKEMRDCLEGIDLDSIYYHFWGGLLQPRFEEREYNNDFASWAWYSFHDAVLAERLAVVDPTKYPNLEELRRELVEIVDERFDEKESLAWVQATMPFEFIRSQIVVFDTGKRVGNAGELSRSITNMSTSSIFYHFIDARRRVPDGQDDFSCWLAGSREDTEELCGRLLGIDPYFTSLSQLKRQLQNLFSLYLQEGR